MTVVACSIGIHAKFVRQLEDNGARTNANGRDHPDGGLHAQNGEHPHNDFSIDQAQLNTVLSPALRELFNEAIAVNSTAFQDIDPETKELIFVGSKTETALLQFAKELKWTPFEETRDGAKIRQMIPFSTKRKAMGVVVEVKGGGYRLYLKGASEILSRKCTRHVVVHPPSQADNSVDRGYVETKEIDQPAEENISRTINFYASQTLRTIALCYRDFESWPPTGADYDDDEDVSFEYSAQDMTLIGITGVEDPLRDDVRGAVARVAVEMCTGDNVLNAQSLATQCGIFTSGGITTGIRQPPGSEMIEIAPRLPALTSISPTNIPTTGATSVVVAITKGPYQSPYISMNFLTLQNRLGPCSNSGARIRGRAYGMRRPRPLLPRAAHSQPLRRHRFYEPSGSISPSARQNRHAHQFWWS